MKIHILCNDGSPVGVTLKDLWGEGNRGIGLGGSEYALLTMCEMWHLAGHEVVLYNSPMTPDGSPFPQRPIHEFIQEEPRDVLIVFRSPNIRSIHTSKCLKVWWSCDQFTVGDFREFSAHMHKIVCISDFHSRYFVENYGITNSIVIDLPVRIQDIIDAGKQEKVPKSLLFTSVPDRGLHYLRNVWPDIQDRCPGINLTITSDYRLWGVEERNQSHREVWQNVPNVRFLGAVPRRQLIVEQLRSQILSYPCIYDELFCISVAEAQCCGVLPITSDMGALRTTNVGYVIPGNPSISGEFRNTFVDTIANLMNGDYGNVAKLQNMVKNVATARFHPNNIMRQWDEKVFGG